MIQAYEQLKKIGALEWSSLQCIEPDDDLGTLNALLDFHHPIYCKSVLEWYDLKAKDLWSTEEFGFSKMGTVPFVGMAEIAQQYVSATRSAVRFAIDYAEEPVKVVCFAGEQPHAYRQEANNGDVFNDVALALLDADKLAKKIAFISLDAEHPTVVQDLFFSNSNVMMISLHEDPFFLYPCTGQTVEIGTGEGRGYNINIPLPPRAGDEQLDQAFKQVIHPLLTKFSPNVVIMLGGPSAHANELLSHLRLTTYGYQNIVNNLAQIAPRFVLLGGSGTDWQVSARLWALATATLAGQVDQTDQSTISFKANERSHAFDFNILQDKSIARLSHSMRKYVDYTFQSTLLDVQRLIFPLWNIPISLDEAQVLENIDSLTEKFTTENKISSQLSSNTLSENEPKLRAKTPDLKIPTHSLNETAANSSVDLQKKSTSIAVAKAEKSETKDGIAELEAENNKTLATNKTSTHQPKSRSNRSKRLPPTKRKRSRSRRKRSGGK